MSEPSEFVLRRISQIAAEKMIEPHRQIALDVRKFMEEKMDDDVKGFIDESHLAFGAACAYEAYQQLFEHNASFELQWKATQRGIEKWREANPGNELVSPDYADLIAWLLEKAFPTPTTQPAGKGGEG